MTCNFRLSIRTFEGFVFLSTGRSFSVNLIESRCYPRSFVVLLEECRNSFWLIVGSEDMGPFDSKCRLILFSKSSFF